MRSMQAAAAKAAAVTTLSGSLVSQAAAILAGCADKGAAKLSVKELNRRFDRALAALKGEEGTSPAPSANEEWALHLAKATLNTYRFDKETRTSRFILPPGVTDSDMMRALNVYFRRHYPAFRRDAISEAAIGWCEKNLSERDALQFRELSLIASVKGTKGKDREAQSEKLASKKLGFADERDLVLAAALHACKHKGKDLFKGRWIRANTIGIALVTFDDAGVVVRRYRGHIDHKDVAAAGARASKRA